MNLDDPVFVLSSCSFDASQQEAMFQHFAWYPGPELKASRLRKTEEGQRSILDFLYDPSVNSQTAAVFVIHKPFMIVTKYCDAVLEPSVKEAGLNFYERGLNLATANLLTTTMPVILNPTSWNNFLAAFVRVVRERTRVAFRDFVRLAELIYSHLEHANKEIAYNIAPVLLLRAEDFLPLLSDHELDPLVPAYYSLVDHWGKQLCQRFEIRADQSKVLVKERETLLALSDESIAPVAQGFDYRKVEFPLKAASIAAVDSANERQVQLADVLAGVVAAALKSENCAKEGAFERQALRLCFEKQLVIGGIWPNREVDPVKLGTDEPPTVGQFDLASYTAMVLQKQLTTRKPET